MKMCAGLTCHAVINKNNWRLCTCSTGQCQGLLHASELILGRSAEYVIITISSSCLYVFGVGSFCLLCVFFQ